MKYYIPTSSLNFNNILSTESLSPKNFYERRGFGYSRWFSVEENDMEHVTLLYDTPHTFERPKSDVEDHPMLIEIDVEDVFPAIAEGVYYTDQTIYLNPWQTKFIFFSEKDKTTVLSLSDSSLETKLVRLYQRKILVRQFDGIYPEIHKDSIASTGDIDCFIGKDYIINKMKGLLYGYYIGANLSSSKEHVQKLDTLREILNIFSSVLSSYDKTPSDAQRLRLNDLFDYLDSQQPIYSDLEKEVGDRQLVERIFAVFKRHGYIFTSIDRTKIVYGLQDGVEYNKSIAWVNREIARTKALMESSRVLLKPDDAEIIVSSKDGVIAQKTISDNVMSKLFVSWVNDVLCSKTFNGKINSIKELLSDEITKSAKKVIGAEWEDSPIRSYLNQLRRHVRGEEFSPTWDNGVLSSISAVLLKGDEWEELLNFMQSKGMNDYRIAFAMYGVLHGFANMTRDFTDLLLNRESNYLSMVYREMYGQLLEKSISDMSQSTPTLEANKSGNSIVENELQTIVLQNSEETLLKKWQNEIRVFAHSVVKRDKQKLLKSLEDALVQNGTNQDYFTFITMLDNFEGWKPGKNGPSSAWVRMREHYVPDYDQRIGKHLRKQNAKRILPMPPAEMFLFDNIETVETNTEPGARIGESILEDTSWIHKCASFINDSRASHQFIEDMDWFVGNHSETYNDKKKGLIQGYYASQDRTNICVQERLRSYLENKVKPKNEKMQWLADIYVKIPIDKIMSYIYNKYGN